MRYIVCGIEHIGLKVVNALLLYNEDVTVITLNKEEPLLQDIKENVKFYLEGDARHKKVLEAAGIYNADVLMILTSNDVHNIEIHLTAREMNKNIKIITSLNNEEGLSEEIEAGFAITKAINIPSFSAPSFVSSCLDDSILHIFKYHEKPGYLVQEDVIPDLLTFGKTIGDIEKSCKIKIIQLVKPDGSHSFPMKDTLVQVGDRILFLTFDKNFLHSPKNNIFLESFDTKVRKTSIIKKATLKFIKSFPSNLRTVLLLYAALIILSTLFYFINMKLSLIDAFYFVITTTSTVGFGDISLKDETPLVKLYGTFMMISGAALLAAFFSIFADYIISKRFEQFLGSSIYKRKNHVIVVGLGSIGYRVANMLHENGVKVAVIENNPENSYIHLLQHKIPVVYGDAQAASILNKAGIARARTIASLINDDIKNMNIVLHAKKLNSSIRTITRIFNQKIENVIENKLGIGKIHSTSSFTVPLFLASSLQENTITAFYMDSEIYMLFEISSIYMTQLQILTRDYGIIILEPFTYEDTANPHGNDNMGSSTKKFLAFGSYPNVKKLVENKFFPG